MFFYDGARNVNAIKLAWRPVSRKIKSEDLKKEFRLVTKSISKVPKAVPSMVSIEHITCTSHKIVLPISILSVYGAARVM